MKLRVIIFLLSALADHHFSQATSSEQAKALFFPAMTTLQVTMCTVTNGRLFKSPKKDYPVRRLGINLGFQVNYNLPYRLMDFYKPAYWARALIGVVQGRFKPTTVVSARDFKRSVTHPSSDLTAGQLYRAVEELLQAMEFGSDCLAKSVCELAHSPFHREPHREDLLVEVTHFLLTPSFHRSFGELEYRDRTKYEMAENLGVSGADCELIYANCPKSLLEHYSKFE
ncbi:uncharacterized protein LOC126566549 [Anopheles maculipalpis]|uniref:uncharacterized protein LOC126566549 n=1 Tax=Anopheles maculipalpis TaxID=1496333 RepID=UPI0021595D54|nr:uncharacterized protein LOC126566549 [Anopheles maculipalpis]